MKAKELIALLATDPEAEVLICPDNLKVDSIGSVLWQKVNRAYKPLFWSREQGRQNGTEAQSPILIVTDNF